MMMELGVDPRIIDFILGHAGRTAGDDMEW